MMNTLDVLILGIVQGLTEFLPISSSGHLVVIEQILAAEEFRRTGVALEISLHVGTLFAILFFYRVELLNVLAWASGRNPGEAAEGEAKALLKWIVIGSIPTALIGLLFKDWLESCFDDPVLVGVALCATGGLCLATRFIPRGGIAMEGMGAYRALFVGAAQGLAIIPGLSRSGTTIVAALSLKVNPRDAGRYSFLLSVPAVAGAALIKMLDGGPSSGISLIAFAVGMLSAALVGFACLSMLIRLLKRGNFFIFGFYCIPLGLFVIWYFA